MEGCVSTGASDPMAEDFRVAAVIPCYNEEAHVAAVIRGLLDVVDFVVAVDDCSTDRTWEILGSLESADLIRVRHDRNRGVGAAMATGYLRALELGAEVCVKVDGDGQMAPEHIPGLVGPVLRGEADYAKGNRFHNLPALTTMPRIRLLGNGMLSFLTKLASGYWSVFDPTNGFTAISRGALERLDLRRIPRSYFFESGMLIELNIQRAVVRDVPIPARYGSERSSLRIGRVLWEFPPLLLRGLVKRFFWRYMIQDFNALTICVLAGVPALVFGIVFGSYHWWLSTTTGVAATAGTTILAALPILLGFQCLLTAFVLDILYQPRLEGPAVGLHSGARSGEPHPGRERTVREVEVG